MTDSKKRPASTKTPSASKRTSVRSGAFKAKSVADTASDFKPARPFIREREEAVEFDAAYRAFRMSLRYTAKDMALAAVIVAVITYVLTTIAAGYTS